MGEHFVDLESGKQQTPSERLSLIGLDGSASMLPKLEYKGADPLPALDIKSLNPAATDSQQAVFKNQNQSLLNGYEIAGATGLLAGAGLTAATQHAAFRLFEPVARTLGAIAFAPLGGRVAANIMYAPPVPWYETLAPRPIAIGAAVGAAIAIGGYELYKRW